MRRVGEQQAAQGGQRPGVLERRPGSIARLGEGVAGARAFAQRTNARKKPCVGILERSAGSSAG